MWDLNLLVPSLTSPLSFRRILAPCKTQETIFRITGSHREHGHTKKHWLDRVNEDTYFACFLCGAVMLNKDTLKSSVEALSFLCYAGLYHLGLCDVSLFFVLWGYQSAEKHEGCHSDFRVSTSATLICVSRTQIAHWLWTVCKCFCVPEDWGFTEENHSILPFTLLPFTPGCSKVALL